MGVKFPDVQALNQIHMQHHPQVPWSVGKCSRTLEHIRSGISGDLLPDLHVFVIYHFIPFLLCLFQPYALLPCLCPSARACCCSLSLSVLNFTEKYFEMPKKQCREALDIYKKFLVRMERVSEFLRVAEVSS